MWNGEFRDPRLVEVYDALYPWSREDDFFMSIVDEHPSSRVLDLGCGTGRLALGMARAGHAVTGVDPAVASLDAARRKPGGESVTWIEGSSTSLPTDTFETAVMTSHVAQFLVGDDEWAGTLADLERALVADGRLVFDSRDPAGRAWERWNPVDSRRRVELTDGSIVDSWTEVTDVSGGVVSFTHHYIFGDGDELASESTLRFRTEGQLGDSLRDAGFAVDRIYGGWRCEPVGSGDGEFLVIARAGAPCSSVRGSAP